MRKIFLILILLAMPSMVMADSWLVQKVTGVKDKITGEEQKPAVKSDNPADYERATWAVAVRMPVFVYPEGGDRQMALAFSDLWVFHNMSKGFLSFFAFTKILSDAEKKEKEGSDYSNSWDYRLIGAGAQWYLTKGTDFNVAIYGGFAKMLANDDEQNEPALGIAEVIGVKLDIPYKADDPFGWNYEIAYEDITVENKEDEIEKALGDSGIRSLMVGIRIPL